MTTETKKRMGRPPFEPTPRDRAQVKFLAAIGTKEDDIARVVGVSHSTLRKYFAEELDSGLVDANTAVAKSLFKMATNSTKPNVAAAIFWLKVRAGWREKPEGTPAEGKKEQAETHAKTAHEGTAWAGLLQ